MAKTDSNAAVMPDRKAKLPEPHRPVYDEYLKKTDLPRSSSKPNPTDRDTTGLDIHVQVPSVPTTRPVEDMKLHDTSFSKNSDSLSLAVDSIETEYDALSKRYTELLNRVQHKQQIGDTINLNESVSDLNTVIDSLEKKGQQLHWMKTAQKNVSGATPIGKASPMAYERCVVHSPEASRRKTAALSLLREYRDMDKSAL